MSRTRTRSKRRRRKQATPRKFRILASTGGESASPSRTLSPLVVIFMAVMVLMLGTLTGVALPMTSPATVSPAIVFHGGEVSRDTFGGTNRDKTGTTTGSDNQGAPQLAGSQHFAGHVLIEAERVGFEPTVTQCATPVFETGSFSRSDTSPESPQDNKAVAAKIKTSRAADALAVTPRRCVSQQIAVS